MPGQGGKKYKLRTTHALLAKSSNLAQHCDSLEKENLTGNLISPPDSPSIFPHPVFCLRLFCPLAFNCVGQQESPREIKVRKERVGAFTFQSSSLQHYVRLAIFPALKMDHFTI